MRQPRRTIPPPLRRLAWVAASIAVGVALPGCTRNGPIATELAAYRRASGTVTRAESSAAVPRGRYLKQRIRLTSSTGLLAAGWLFRPDVNAGCLPAVLLQDGREENSGVIERLPADFGDIVVLSLDYPADMPYAIQLGDVVRRGDQLEQAARKIPAIFLLGGAYLASRGDVDTARIALAATSFAVPFATIAAAADARFANVALIYGGGDLPSILAANLTVRPAALRRPLAWMAMQRFAGLAPERFVGRIAPRPVIMVNGIDDPQMPRAAAERLYDAARQPKELIWMRTGHLMPTDSALIRTLVDTALARLPVLHGGASPGCVPRDARPP